MPAADDVIIRPARETDLPALGRLGAQLMRLHYAFDRDRFMAPAPGRETDDGYAWFLGTQLRAADAAVFTAERDGAVLGYVYVGIEPQSWKELREEAGFIHDIVVDPAARRSGVASALMAAAFDWLRARGIPRVILGTATQNEGAQQLFERLGFRKTMIEMTRELEPRAPHEQAKTSGSRESRESSASRRG